MASRPVTDDSLRRQNDPRWFTQILAVTAISFGAFINGTTMSLPTVAIPSLKEANDSLALRESHNSTGGGGDINETASGDHWSIADIPFYIYDEDFSLFASVPAFGTMFGSLVAGPLANAIGRKWTTVLGVNLTLTLGYALIAGAQLKWMMFLGRFLHGVSLAFSTTIATIYIMEVATSDLRGRLAVVPGIFGTLGILTVQIFGSMFNWRLICIICGCFNIPFFIGLLFIPETPVFLISKNCIDKAHEVLRMLRGPNWNITEELTNIKVAADGHKASQGAEDRVQLRELFSKPALRPFMASLILMFFLQFTGINIIVSFTQQIFQIAHSSIDANQATIYFGISLLVSNGLTLTVADRMPRRLMLLLSSSFVSLALIGLGLFLHFKSIEGPSCSSGNMTNASNATTLLEAPDYYSGVCTTNFGWLPLLILMLYIFFFSLGYGCMIWITMVELMPQRVRTVTASLASCFCSLCSFILTLTYLDLMKATSSQTVYWIYGSVSALGFLFILFFIPETKGKTEAEIQSQIHYRRKPPASSNETAEELSSRMPIAGRGSRAGIPTESEPLNSPELSDDSQDGAIRTRL